MSIIDPVSFTMLLSSVANTNEEMEDRDEKGGQTIANHLDMYNHTLEMAVRSTGGLWAHRRSQTRLTGEKSSRMRYNTNQR
jgi:hypothetical protein